MSVSETQPVARTAYPRSAIRLGTLGAAMAGLILVASPARADHAEKHFPVQSKPRITVRNLNGRIQVKTWTKSEVQVNWSNARFRLKASRMESVFMPRMMRSNPFPAAAKTRSST